LRMKFFAFALAVLVAITGASAQGPAGDAAVQAALATFTNAVNQLVDAVGKMSDTVTSTVRGVLLKLTGAVTALQAAISTGSAGTVQGTVAAKPITTVINALIGLVSKLLDGVISLLSKILVGPLNVLLAPLIQLNAQIVNTLNTTNIALAEVIVCITDPVGPILDLAQTFTEATADVFDKMVVQLEVHLDNITSIVVDEVHKVTAIINTWKNVGDIIAGVPALVIHVSTLLITLPRTTAQVTDLIQKEVGLLTNGLGEELTPTDAIVANLTACLQAVVASAIPAIIPTAIP